MSRRKITKKTRFEVFKRDSFKCQYCGATAPDVVLQVDHIKPVSKGGDNEVVNLLTACQGCNSGKSDTELHDDAAIAKQRAQLEDLNERREQLEMMLEWREGLRGIEDDALEALNDRFFALTNRFFTDSGKQKMRKLIRDFGLDLCLSALDEGASYLRTDENGDVTQESAEVLYSRLGGICGLKSKPDSDRLLYYARGILRNKLPYMPPGWRVLRLLKSARDAGADPEELREIAKDVRNWTEFRNVLSDEWGVSED